MIPKKLYVRELDIDIFNEEAEATRSWVANRPNTGRREYTDLSQVWHNSKEEPEKGKSIISIGEAGVSAYKWVDEWRCDWSDFAEWSGLTGWAYADDLLPKGGKQ